MLEAIVENTITKENEYLYLKKVNNGLIYYGFSIQNNNVSPIDKNIINKIYNLLRVNENCIYIEDYLDYKVYLDKENNIKHYLKNGVEDFLMLFKNNGEDLRVYNTSKDNKNSKTDSKKFCIKNFIISVSIGLVLGLVSTSIIQTQLRGGNIINSMQNSLSKSAYSISEYINLDLKCINCEEAINLINSSDLPLDLKEVLANESLLQDVFPYYENTNMEYIIKNKLKDLKLRVYEPDDIFITDPNTTNGFYIEIVPNVLNVKNEDGYEETAKHEFIHLLQSTDRKYIFLQEAVAEIAAVEYLNKSIGVYPMCVLNVEMLMDTIGPKIIWETVFSGDDTNLKNVLKANLNESEYNELISYLTSKPKETIEDCQRFNQIVSNLYRNINHKELHDDRNIYNELGYHVSRIYFNEDKMKDNGIYGIDSKIDYEFIPINEIFKDQTVRVNNSKVK